MGGSQARPPHSSSLGFSWNLELKIVYHSLSSRETKRYSAHRRKTLQSSDVDADRRTTQVSRFSPVTINLECSTASCRRKSTCECSCGILSRESAPRPVLVSKQDFKQGFLTPRFCSSSCLAVLHSKWSRWGLTDDRADPLRNVHSTTRIPVLATPLTNVCSRSSVLFDCHATLLDLLKF